MQRRVEWRDVDFLQHLNNAAYVAYIEECSIQVGTYFGWPIQRTLGQGLAWVTREHHVRYLQPAVLEDELEIMTWMCDVKRASGRRFFHIKRQEDEVLLAEVATLWTCVNVASGRPVRIPQNLIADFAPNIAEV